MIDDLYNKIGQILVMSCPDDAVKIVTGIQIAKEDDAVSYYFNYFDNKNNKKEFKPVSKARDDIFYTMLELKKYFIDNNLTNGKPIWAGCIVEIDIKNSKINFEFKYERFIPLFEDDDLKD